MTETITFQPHPDIELGYKREPINAYLNFPEHGIDIDTGVLLLVDGLRKLPRDDEFSKDLKEYLANTMNCIVVSVDYFGIFRNAKLHIPPSLINNLNRIYNLNISREDFNNARSSDDVYRKLAEYIIQRGITSLDLRCQFKISTGRNEYQSWGLLPAIDCLQALGEVFKRYIINPERIIAYGSYYGGYIALLLGKFAPQTFSVIIDQSGYTKTELKHVVSGEVMEEDYTYAFNIRHSDLKFTIASASNNPWTIEDETSPFYFGDHHRKIRSLLYEKHKMKSPTRYHIFHSEDDETNSIIDKDRCVQILQQYNTVFYHRSPPQIDYKILDKEHFPYKSLKGLADKDIFDWLIITDDQHMKKPNPETDFNLNNKYIFDCGEKTYQFQFSDSNDISVFLLNS